MILVYSIREQLNLLKEESVMKKMFVLSLMALFLSGCATTSNGGNGGKDFVLGGLAGYAVSKL